MAIQKSIVDGAGNTNTYHTVQNLRYALGAGWELEIASYVSAAARVANKRVNELWSVQIPDASIDKSNPIFPQLYAFVKADARYQGSADV